MLAFSVGALRAETLWVKTPAVDLREGKGSMFSVTGTVPKGTELSVVSREGSWVQVEAGTVKGWVYESSLSPQKVDSGSLGSIRSAQMNTGAASRGVGPMATQYAASKNYSHAALDALVALNKHIPSQECITFNQQLQAEAQQRR
jgi:uncharacterized protein YraI